MGRNHLHLMVCVIIWLKMANLYEHTMSQMSRSNNIRETENKSWTINIRQSLFSFNNTVASLAFFYFRPYNFIFSEEIQSTWLQWEEEGRLSILVILLLLDIRFVHHTVYNTSTLINLRVFFFYCIVVIDIEVARFL